MRSRNALAARSCSSSNLQHTGSFKVRGASNKILSLGSDLEATVVAASSGNHGAAVAYVLRELGDKGLIFVPTGASPAKVENIRHFGAEVVFFGEDSIETETHARGWAATHGWAFVSPYNDSAVVAGQGTLGIEIARQAGQVDNVFVAVGGGGLIGGIALLLKSVNPGVRIIGCSPAASNVMARSVRAGRIVSSCRRGHLVRRHGGRRRGQFDDIRALSRSRRPLDRRFGSRDRRGNASFHRRPSHVARRGGRCRDRRRSQGRQDMDGRPFGDRDLRRQYQSGNTEVGALRPSDLFRASVLCRWIAVTLRVCNVGESR